MTKPLLKRDPAHEYMSFDDFEELLQDKPEDARWELINGRVIRGMVGAVFEHHAIIGNLDLAISNHLRENGRECRTYRETFYLKERMNDLSALPDLMVRCGPHPRGATSVDDPTILVEIVSPGSLNRDRLEKRIAYQALPSLQSYVLIERDQVMIDVYQRTPAGFVGAAPLQQLTDVLELPAIDFEMTVAEVYGDVFSAS
jgi:Uma2 family endonuclease